MFFIFPLGIFLVRAWLTLLIDFIEGNTMTSCEGEFHQAQGGLSPSAQGFAELLDTKFEIAEMEH